MTGVTEKTVSFVSLDLNVAFGFWGKQNSLFPLGPVNKCLLFYIIQFLSHASLR